MSKSIFITGAGSGIGKTTAELFYKKGWFVGLFDKNEAALAETAKSFSADRSCWKSLDVTNEADYAAAISFFSEKTGGKMDALFNCAGVMFMGPFEELSLKQHRITYDVNVFGVINGVYNALPLLKKTSNASVVSMGSASGFYGVPDLASYSSSKFAVRGLTEALSLELEKYDIRVTDLMPLYVNTPMVRTQTYQAGTLKTFGAQLTPELIAGIVWDAVHGNKVHWVPTAKLKFLTTLARFFPFAERTVMKTLGM